METEPSTSSSTASIFTQMKRKKGQVTTFQPWVEKYRPKTVSDVVYQDEVVAVLQKCLTGSDFPNLLFFGSPGTGKTSAILAMAHEMFGKFVKDRVLELNSSDERGIDVIRHKVKNFSGQKVTNRLPDGTKCPAFRIVILDEADSMTPAAQSALRRVIESSTNNTRFCLICNYITRIIEPIASRCTKFRFKPLTRELVTKRLNEIAAAENMAMDEDALNEIISIADGDMRKAITLMHSVYRLKADTDPAGSKSAHVVLQDVYSVSGYILPEDFDPVINSIRSGNLINVMTAVKDLVAGGYSGSQFMSQLLDYVMDQADLSNEEKCVILKKMGTAEYELQQGANQFLQIMSVSALLLTLFKHPDVRSIKLSYRID